MSTNAYITPDKVRLFMLDRNAGDNFLLDDVDMSTELIELSMELTVDAFNTMSPILGSKWSVLDFPYKLEFLLGVTGRLLRSKGMNLMRNALDYQSTSGTAVNDKTKAASYLALGQEFLAEFEARSRTIKQATNIEEGFGYTGGFYGRFRF
jgi:hypothetical protein